MYLYIPDGKHLWSLRFLPSRQVFGPDTDLKLTATSVGGTVFHKHVCICFHGTEFFNISNKISWILCLGHWISQHRALHLSQ